MSDKNDKLDAMALSLAHMKLGPFVPSADFSGDDGIMPRRLAAQMGAQQANGRADRTPKVHLQIETVQNGYILEFGRGNGSVPQVYVATDLEQVQAEVVRAITELRLEE